MAEFFDTVDFQERLSKVFRKLKATENKLSNFKRAAERKDTEIRKLSAALNRIKQDNESLYRENSSLRRQMRTRQKKLDEEAATEKLLQDAQMKARVEEKGR